ncbi:MAG: glucan biosynthesis protein G [Opitutus sp.]|nr:glucan biosynthesis protein G [Opitutus sp.]
MNLYRLNAALLAAFVLPALLSRAGAIERATVNHDYVKQIAAEVAKEPHESPREQVTAYFRKLGYDDYRRIRFIPDASLWRGDKLPFQIQFFHPGYLFNQTIELNEFTPTHTQPIPFSVKFFDYQNLTPSFWSRRGLNYAGFRVIHELNAPEKWDEVVSFLGASYFRALAKGQRYGISARGLALNAGGPATEEFPSFIEFWLGKPDPSSKSLTLHALLDSRSVTGAYTFVITPGETTIVDVQASLFFRQGVELPGMAPMSSMFWYGENSPDRFGDFRPEVHDSDGLLVAATKDERLWRPLINPTTILRSDFAAPALKGFGLLQRDRDFRSYEDLEAHYHARPSIWVEAIGQWPAGRVRLVEMPTKDEYHDNITAFFTPDQPVAPGTSLDLHWRLHWTNQRVFGGPEGWVRATRQTAEDGRRGRTRYVIDFDGLSVKSVPADADLEADVSIRGEAKLEHQNVVRNDTDGSWRLVLIVTAAPDAPSSELRARLKLGDRVLTETWAMTWKP